jgi:hypothetical protein
MDIIFPLEGGSATEKFLLIDSPNTDFQPILSGGETVKKHLYLLLSLVVLASMILTACGGAAPATEEPPAATEPASTEPAVTEPAATEPAATEPAAGSGIAVITYVQQPTTLNPLYANQWFSTITTQFFLKSLWSFDPDGNQFPSSPLKFPVREWRDERGWKNSDHHLRMM